MICIPGLTKQLSTPPMKFLPTDISTFSTMITENYIYVDKTEYIYNLFKPGASRYYFLSRPRRFGKTLLISTLKELFLARRDLFKDLWIDNSKYTWDYHPVVHLDFSVIAHRSKKDLEESLNNNLDGIAQAYGFKLDTKLPEDKFRELIETLAQKNSVVLLIDEYDKPLLDHLKNIPEALEQRDFLKSFYDVLKGMDAYMRAIFITGVSKFVKTSIFSGINNLNDISLDPLASLILGYSYEELKIYFTSNIQALAKKNDLSVEATFENIRKWYNGYRFSELPVQVYNPFSVLYVFKKGKFKNYWFESGTPSFLVALLKAQYQSLEEVTEFEISQSSLGAFELENIPLVPLLFQTGYLTFTDYNPQTDKFKLNYPNFEVEESFKKYLVASLAYTNAITVDTTLSKLLASLNHNKLDDFCATIEQLFAHIPYTLHINQESYYHSLFQFLMSLLSLESQSEVLTDKGRIDHVIILDHYIYIFELKLNKSPEEALQQIKEKQYYQRYLGQRKPLVLVGISFSKMPTELTIAHVKEEL